ncbi:response regulator transcription factor [Nocardia sp. CDC153]|uniref:response regulator transcription factor n=1 Tax=Nocardia sp. CDC153 TaxID=3112167 RepID=UPI002DBF91CB|nr:response regulator transcription factor [Nocardia sp. CDC153]MEC3956934.1 response regulator transcription factor [Nocardia sp. CDC153]
MIRIAIVDDHPLIRDGVRGWCAAAQPHILVAADHPDPAAFLAATGPDRGDLDAIVLDLQFDQRAPDLTALATICARGHRVVVYSQHTEPHLVRDCLDLGAVTYLSKTEGREHLIAALHAAADVRPYLSPTMARAMSTDADDRPKLSHREREVLLAWFQTESKALVAQQLYITVGTVNTHLERIRAKYAAVGRSAPTKAALVARAIRDGLITTDEL